MTASVRRPEDAVNAALVRIGYPLRVNSLVDGTKAARLALQIYSQSRDALLRDGDWGFAQIALPGVPSGAFPLGQWSQSYLYPGDCLRVRNVVSATYLADQTDPLPVLWEISSSSVGRAILTNEANATIVYTQQIINPENWEPLFADALIADLARHLAPALASLDAAKVQDADVKAALPMAGGMVG